MPTPDPRLERLLQDYFDGTIDAAGKAELEQRLRGDAAARQAYWEIARWHAAFSTWGEQHAGREEAEAEFRPAGSAPVVPRRRIFSRLAWAGALAACLALAAVFAWKAAAPQPLAQLTFGEDAVWGENVPLAGAALGRGKYRLERGTVRFETTAGAVVTVAAPARFDFVAADRIEMMTGKLTARMLRQAGRLTVKIGDLEVRDLGTAFGIDANDAGRTLVSVFDGLVAVKSRLTFGGEVRVAEGQSFVNERHAGTAELAKFEPEAFKDLWPLTVGINDASKLVEFLPPGPLLRPLRDYRANDHLFLFPERQNAVSATPLEVDMSPDVPVWPESPVSPYPLPRGQRVDSYLLFFQPNAAPSGLRHLHGEITFQRRVLGVICSDRALDESDGEFGDNLADYKTPGQRRGLEEADKENYRGAQLPHDKISLSADGRTVKFDFHVADEREQLRVIVAAQ